MARGGRVVMISDAAGVARLAGRLAFGIAVPRCDPFVAPLLYAIPIQLLAYHAAVTKAPTSTSRATSPNRSRSSSVRDRKEKIPDLAAAIIWLN